jgi:hypothetical protein
MIFSTSGYISGHPISAVSTEGTFSTATLVHANYHFWLRSPTPNRAVSFLFSRRIISEEHALLRACLEKDIFQLDPGDVGTVPMRNSPSPVRTGTASASLSSKQDKGESKLQRLVSRTHEHNQKHTENQRSRYGSRQPADTAGVVCLIGGAELLIYRL